MRRSIRRILETAGGTLVVAGAVAAVGGLLTLRDVSRAVAQLPAWQQATDARLRDLENRTTALESRRD